jgi:Ceramidase
MEITLATFFSKRWGWLTIWVLCFVFFLLLSLIMNVANVHPWSDVSKDRIAWYHQEECEKVDTSAFFLQFLNFWSNFTYLAAGLLIVWLSNSGVGRAIGIVLIVLAVGSGWFHGTLTEFGQTFDMVGVYCALTAMIAYGFVELIPLEQDGIAAWLLLTGALTLGTVAGIIRGSLKLFDSDYFTPLLVGLLVFYMVMVFIRYKTTQDSVLWPIVGFAGSGLLALIFKFTDGDKNVFAPHGGNYAKCTYDPTGLIQGHALWHILSAVMFVCIYEYIRSVQSRSQSVWPWRVQE